MAYPALELGLPGTPACPNRPEEEASLWCPGSRRIILQIAVNPVFVQLGYMEEGRGAGLGSVRWQPPKPFMPCLAALERVFDAVRVYNYTNGAEAQALILADDQ